MYSETSLLRPPLELGKSGLNSAPHLRLKYTFSLYFGMVLMRGFNVVSSMWVRVEQRLDLVRNDIERLPAKICTKCELKFVWFHDCARFKPSSNVFFHLIFSRTI